MFNSDRSVNVNYLKSWQSQRDHLHRALCSVEPAFPSGPLSDSWAHYAQCMHVSADSVVVNSTADPLCFFFEHQLRNSGVYLSHRDTVVFIRHFLPSGVGHASFARILFLSNTSYKIPAEISRLETPLTSPAIFRPTTVTLVTQILLVRTLPAASPYVHFLCADLRHSKM
jgi:hypothetical protein